MPSQQETQQQIEQLRQKLAETRLTMGRQAILKEIYRLERQRQFQAA